MHRRRKQPAPVVVGCAQASTAARACGYMVRVASRAAQGRLLLFGSAAPPFSRRGGPLTPPEGVMGPLLRPSWRLQSAAPLWSTLLPTPAAMRWFNSSSLWPMLWPAVSSSASLV